MRKAVRRCYFRRRQRPFSARSISSRRIAFQFAMADSVTSDACAAMLIASCDVPVVSFTAPSFIGRCTASPMRLTLPVLHRPVCVGLVVKAQQVVAGLRARLDACFWQPEAAKVPCSLSLQVCLSSIWACGTQRSLRQVEDAVAVGKLPEAFEDAGVPCGSVSIYPKGLHRFQVRHCGRTARAANTQAVRWLTPASHVQHPASTQARRHRQRADRSRVR